MRALGGIIAAAALLATAQTASAQQGWPQEPMVIGVGYNTCRQVLAAPADERRAAMVSQWALGFYSGIALAGGEADNENLVGLDAALKRFLRTAPDIRVVLNDRIITGCARQPEEPIAQIALNVLDELINEDRE